MGQIVSILGSVHQDITSYEMGITPWRQAVGQALSGGPRVQTPGPAGMQDLETGKGGRLAKESGGAERR